MEAVKTGKNIMWHEDLDESILVRTIKDASVGLSLLEASIRSKL